ncbi:MAG TPA: helix-turn-helix transcriptional regulator [Planctomycetota bacterium]|nr:helix-turn-helix transcriptional regulator [Planctomycetota bacterium]
MNDAKRRRLEKAGWRTGTVQEFLGLTDEEAAFIEVKLLLTRRLKSRRRELRLTQHAVAKRIGSSQSRVAKMEAGDSSVSLDLLVLALFALGDTPRTLGRLIARAA